MTQAISPLRQRMIEDMRMRKFSPKTQNAYIRAVRRFAAFLGRTPDSANDEDLRRYQLHLVVQGISPISLNATITALKFFFEVADIFRAHGPAWRQAQHGHLRLGQLKGMSAIEQGRSAALGGHVLRCDPCAQGAIAHNSCRNPHCPKCQANAARRWLEARQADLLPLDYYHVVFTLPAPISAIAYTNKAVLYDLLFEVAAETLRTIAADPKHLGAQIGVTLVLHTWGSALTHHPHVHGIVPGRGLAPHTARS